MPTSISIFQKNTAKIDRNYLEFLSLNQLFNNQQHMTIWKSTLLLFLFILLTQTAWCDTLNHWTIHHNKELLRQFNETNKDLTHTLAVQDIQKNDTLSFHYFPCAHCIDCIYHLEVRPTRRKQTLVLATAQESEALAFNLYNFVRLAQFLFYTQFEFYLYYDTGASGTSRHQRLLVLNLE